MQVADTGSAYGGCSSRRPPRGERHVRTRARLVPHRCLGRVVQRHPDPSGRSSLPGGSHGLERRHRPLPVAHRPAEEQRRRGPDHPAGPRAPAAAGGARRRPQRRRQRHLRHGDRPGPGRPERRLGRRVHRDDPGSRWLHLGAAGRRCRRQRPGDAGRPDLQHRRGRADPRRRHRLAVAQVRLHQRQPARGRAGDRRRGGRAGQCRPKPGAVLGPARRWRQLRRGHRLHLPGAPCRHRPGRPAVLRGRARGRRPRRLRRLGPDRSRRHVHHARPPDRAAGAFRA